MISSWGLNEERTPENRDPPTGPHPGFSELSSFSFHTRPLPRSPHMDPEPQLEQDQFWCTSSARCKANVPFLLLGFCSQAKKLDFQNTESPNVLTLSWQRDYSSALSVRLSQVFPGRVGRLYPQFLVGGNSLRDARVSLPTLQAGIFKNIQGTFWLLSHQR